ncbi:hypothetical protein [Blautia sp.]|jgi:hypothetical protein|uniref:hypothetical protein n=1 Tax=Blautia sp. TaxID=1955243 RepID=UPI002A753B46|nr:hypothetical protein [Blautia sp.]MDY3016071.1 hypothetical protein [Blautia sp.]
MKLRKCLMVCALAAVMTVGSASVASAAGSRTMNVTVQAEGISVAAKIEESEAYKQLEESAPEVVSILDKVNDGTMEMKDVTAELTKMAEGLTDETAKAALEEVITKLESKDFVTGFVDLTADATAEKNENGKYEVTIDVPSMTDEATGYDVLHYSVERSVWELIEPSETDAEAKTITAEFEDLSPVAVVADAE